MVRVKVSCCRLDSSSHITYCFFAVTSASLHVRAVNELRLFVVLVISEEFLLLVDELDVLHRAHLGVPD